MWAWEEAALLFIGCSYWYITHKIYPHWLCYSGLVHPHSFPSPFVLNYRIVSEFLCLTPCVLCRFFSKRWLVWYLGVEAFRRALPALHFWASGTVMPPLSSQAWARAVRWHQDRPWLACHPSGRWATLWVILCRCVSGLPVPLCLSLGAKSEIFCVVKIQLNPLIFIIKLICLGSNLSYYFML